MSLLNVKCIAGGLVKEDNFHLIRGLTTAEYRGLGRFIVNEVYSYFQYSLEKTINF